MLTARAEGNSLSAMISVSYHSKRIQKAAVRHPGPGVLRSRKRSMPFPAVGTARQNGILLQEPQDRIAFYFRDRRQRTEQLTEIGKTGRERKWFHGRISIHWKLIRIW